MQSATPSKLHEPGTREQALKDWFREQAAPAYDAHRADPSPGLSLDEVRAFIGQR